MLKGLKIEKIVKIQKIAEKIKILRRLRHQEEKRGNSASEAQPSRENSRRS